MNYMVAGAIIERLEDKTWDELMVERIFQPLQLKTAGLGNQAGLGKIDAPLGHVIINGKITAVLPGPAGDNAPVIGPAGIAHMSITDFARWAAWNASSRTLSAGLGRSKCRLGAQSTDLSWRFQRHESGARLA